MLNLYSKKCRYAIRALMKVGPGGRRDGFSLKAVCRRAGLPEAYTRKIFQVLVRSGILAAKRGPGGGYRFARRPADVSLLSVIRVLDGRDAFDRCVLQNRSCGKTGHCVLHRRWTASKNLLVRQLGSCSVDQLLESR
jgi:Rrf2 family protein